MRQLTIPAPLANIMTIRFNILIVLILVGLSCKNKKTSTTIPSSINMESMMIDTSVLSDNIFPQQSDINETSIIDSGHITDIGFVYFYVDESPIFGNGNEDIHKYIVDNVKYPQSAIVDSIQGRVFISFVVKADGYVTKAKVLKGIRVDIDNECISVIENMPKWKPGKQMGKNVNVYFVVPIKFSLDTLIKGTVIRPNQLVAQEPDIKVYPNPARDYISIETAQNVSDIKYQIINSNGQILKSGILSTNNEQIDLNNFIDGFYILRFLSNKNKALKTIKLIIKK